MKNFKRDLFFWIEKLQITRKERVVISALLVIIVIMAVITSIVKQQSIYSSENYESIRNEFESKSAAIKAKKLDELKKYTTQENLVKNKELNEVVTDTIIININTASKVELQKLKGVGETYAQRIVDYRVENGEFKTIDELLNVKGIGKKRLEDIKAFIKLE
jgi:comEA protein